MKATEARQRTEHKRKMIAEAKKTNIFLSQAIKLIKQKADEGCNLLIRRTAELDLTEKDVSDLKELGYNVIYKSNQNYKAWEISW